MMILSCPYNCTRWQYSYTAYAYSEAWCRSDNSFCPLDCPARNSPKRTRTRPNPAHHSPKSPRPYQGTFTVAMATPVRRNGNCWQHASCSCPFASCSWVWLFLGVTLALLLHCPGHSSFPLLLSLALSFGSFLLIF